MISEQEAIARILAAVPAPGKEAVPLEECAGRYCAEDIPAALPLPGFDNSAMDGWAIHAADCGSSGVPLRITGEQPAGAARSLTVHPGEAVRIFTGAPLPAGTGAVVMQEDAEHRGEFVSILEPAAPGEFIRRAGSDLCAGQLIATRGTALTAMHAGLFASQGLTHVRCGRQPRAAVICTGGELTAPGQPLPHPGALYNSNGSMLAALLRTTATAIPTAQDTVADELDSITALFRQRLEECDALIVAGGVSVGDHDLVKPALRQLGIEPEFWRVSVKPGKPFLFGTHGPRLIFGLPGNPVSAFVTSVLFVLPALRKFAGAADCRNILTTARAATPLKNSGDRTHYLRGRYDAATGTFTPSGLQESHALAGLARSNALARLEPGMAVTAGDSVPILLLP